jgi:hypothetical protein
MCAMSLQMVLVLFMSVTFRKEKREMGKTPRNTKTQIKEEWKTLIRKKS